MTASKAGLTPCKSWGLNKGVGWPKNRKTLSFPTGEWSLGVGLKTVKH